MADGQVGATRAGLLDVGKRARVSNSFSHGEVWWLKEVLSALDSPARLAELAADPYRQRVRRKIVALELRARSVRPRDRAAGIREELRLRVERCRADCEATLAAGRPWAVVGSAARFGVSKQIAADATKDIRARYARRTRLTQSELDEVARIFRVLMDAGKWDASRLLPALALRYGCSNHAAELATSGLTRGYRAEHQRRFKPTPAQLEAAEGLLRDLGVAGYDAGHKTGGGR